jgi:hypothetical protein
MEMHGATVKIISAGGVSIEVYAAFLTRMVSVLYLRYNGMKNLKKKKKYFCIPLDIFCRFTTHFWIQHIKQLKYLIFIEILLTELTLYLITD